LVWFDGPLIKSALPTEKHQERFTHAQKDQSGVPGINFNLLSRATYDVHVSPRIRHPESQIWQSTDIATRRNGRDWQLLETAMAELETRSLLELDDCFLDTSSSKIFGFSSKHWKDQHEVLLRPRSAFALGGICRLFVCVLVLWVSCSRTIPILRL
jgi:hypothetical protein